MPIVLINDENKTFVQNKNHRPFIVKISLSLDYERPLSVVLEQNCTHFHSVKKVRSVIVGNQLGGRIRPERKFQIKKEPKYNRRT